MVARWVEAKKRKQRAWRRAQPKPTVNKSVVAEYHERAQGLKFTEGDLRVLEWFFPQPLHILVRVRPLTQADVLKWLNQKPSNVLTAKGFEERDHAPPRVRVMQRMAEVCERIECVPPKLRFLWQGDDPIHKWLHFSIVSGEKREVKMFWKGRMFRIVERIGDTYRMSHVVIGKDRCLFQFNRGLISWEYSWTVPVQT